MNFHCIKSVMLMIMLGVFCLLTPATADQDYLDKQVGKCYVKMQAMQKNCQKMLDRSLEAEGKEEQDLFASWVNCRKDGAEDYDRCRDPKRIAKAFQNKQWKKANKAELTSLRANLEKSDDSCGQIAVVAYTKCGTKKTDKKKSSCVKSASKKLGRCLKKGDRIYNRGIKKLNPPS